MLSVDELNLRLKMLRFAPPSAPLMGGRVLLLELIEAADEPGNGTPLSGVRGGDVERVLPDDPFVSSEECGNGVPSALLVATFARPPYARSGAAAAASTCCSVESERALRNLPDRPFFCLSPGVGVVRPPIVFSSSLVAGPSSSSLTGFVRESGEGKGLRATGVVRPLLDPALAGACPRSTELEVDDIEFVREWTPDPAVANDSVEPSSGRPAPTSTDVVEPRRDGSLERPCLLAVTVGGGRIAPEATEEYVAKGAAARVFAVSPAVPLELVLEERMRCGGWGMLTC